MNKAERAVQACLDAADALEECPIRRADSVLGGIIFLTPSNLRLEAQYIDTHMSRYKTASEEVDVSEALERLKPFMGPFRTTYNNPVARQYGPVKEHPIDSVFHEIMLHFPNIDEEQARAAAAATVNRIDTKSWGFGTERGR